MLIEKDNFKYSLQNLSRQKLEFKRNNTSSLFKNKTRWRKYTDEASNFRDTLKQYIKYLNKKFKLNSNLNFYRSTKSEALYITYNINNSTKIKIRLANHDTVDEADFDVEVKLHECSSMKTVIKQVINYIDNCTIEWRNRVSIDNFDSYFNIALSKKQEYETMIKMRDNSLALKKEYEVKLKDLLEMHRNYEDAINYLKEIIELLSKQHIEHLEKLLNSAVKTIFYDKNYEIKMEISEFRNNNSLNIYLIEYKDNEEIKTDIKSNGFGLQCVVGFILQVYFILYHKLSPVLFMDEALRKS